MIRSEDRILTTHVGSLPRPDGVLAAVRDPELDPRQRAEVLDRAVKEIVHRQIETGVDVINDGEMSKTDFFRYVGRRMNGFEMRAPLPFFPADVNDFPAFAAGFGQAMVPIGEQVAPACVGPVSYSEPHAEVDADVYRLGKDILGQNIAGAFICSASPGMTFGLENLYYPTSRGFQEAFAEALAAEYEAIHKSGFMLQIDAPDLAMINHMSLRDSSRSEVLDAIATHIDLINQATGEIPAEDIRLHVCWGNIASPHTRDIPLREIIHQLLRTNANSLSIEAANPRHGHEWKVFEEVPLPDDKVLVPGVIDTTTNFVEHPDLVAQRIEHYAGIVGRERVIASTDCGFATMGDHLFVSPDVAWAKLASLVEGARIASRHLWA